MLDLLQFGSPGLPEQLSPPLADQLLRLGKTIHYRDQQVVHKRGDAPGLSIVKTGAVQIGNFGLDGSFLTTSIMGPGQCFGEHTLFAGLPRTHDVTAIGETSVDQIPGPAFKRLCDAEPELTKALLTIALVRSHGLLEFFDDMRRMPLPARVAKFLLGMSESARKPDEIHCRQEDLAFTFGVSRVSIGKVLKQLEYQGLIELGYGVIRIPALKTLQEWVAARTMIAPLKAKPGTY